MILREMATLWAGAQIPDADVQAYFLERLDQAVQRRVTWSFTIGRKLTKHDRAYLVYGFRGELFVFELSPEQTARLGLKDDGVRSGESVRPAEWDAIEPSVRLENVKVEGAMELSREARISGSLDYRSERCFLEPLALRVVCDPPGRGCMTLFHHLSILMQPAGDMKFTLSKLGDLANKYGEKFVGIVPLFFQVWTAAESQGASPVSPAAHLHTAGAPIPPTGYQPRNHLSPPIRAVVPEPAREESPKPDRPISDIRAVLVDVV